jgi:phytoene dehydrogenase-like protein
MGAITQAMAQAAAGYGVEIETRAPVREVLIEKGGPAASCSRTGA